VSAAFRTGLEAACRLEKALFSSGRVKSGRVYWTRPGARKPAQESPAVGEYSEVPSLTGGANVLEIFSANPWLVAVAEIAFVTLVGIVCVSVNVCRRKIRLAQFDFELKRDMLQRGLSAEEIRTVIEAGRQAVPNPAPGATGRTSAVAER
jgi:hypothetical protein